MQSVSASIARRFVCTPCHGLGGSAADILRLGFCVGGLVRNDVVDAFAVDLLGLEHETELFAYDACRRSRAPSAAASRSTS